MSEAKKIEGRVRLLNVRLAFPQLFQAKAVNDGDKPAFSASLLIKPDDPQVKTIVGAIEDAALRKWSTKATPMLNQLKATDKVCLHNGDLKSQYAGFEGMLYVSARNGTKPLVLDRDRTKIVSEALGRPYGGCYVNCDVDIYAQDNKYGKRINATLVAVQFSKDGDAFAGGAPADPESFDDLGDTGEGAVEGDSAAALW